jgi:hypothetical protein
MKQRCVLILITIISKNRRAQSRMKQPCLLNLITIVTKITCTESHDENL